MRYLIAVGIWYLAVFVAHAVWFRVRRPRSDVRVLQLLFAAGLVVYAAVALAPHITRDWPAGPPDPWGAPLLLTSILLYAVLAVSYIGVYQASVVLVPSAMIMRLIAAHPEGRMSAAELRAIMTNERLILPRLDDLVAQRAVVFDGTRYRLLPTGALLARIFAAYRRLLRKDLGG